MQGCGSNWVNMVSQNVPCWVKTQLVYVSLKLPFIKSDNNYRKRISFFYIINACFTAGRPKQLFVQGLCGKTIIGTCL